MSIATALTPNNQLLVPVVFGCLCWFCAFARAIKQQAFRVNPKIHIYLEQRMLVLQGKCYLGVLLVMTSLMKCLKFNCEPQHLDYMQLLIMLIQVLGVHS